MAGTHLVSANAGPARPVLAGAALALLAACAAPALWVACASAPPGEGAPDAGAAEAGPPLWQVDLRNMGYPLPEWGGTSPPSERDKIAFGSNGELVVLGDTHAFPKPSRVVAFALDTATGRVTGRAEWTVKLRPRLFATAGGRYAVLTSAGTMLYAAGFAREVARIPEGATMASPGGLSLLVDAPGSKPGQTVQRLVDADTLRPNGAEFVNQAIASICRNGAAHVVRPDRSDRATVLVQDAGRQVPPYTATCGDLRPHFLDEDHMAILGCGRMEVVRLGGGRLLEAPVGGNAALAAVARDGSRFAVIDPEWTWRDVPRLVGETIRVHDIGTGAAVWAVRVATLRDSDFPASSGAALSPDGTLLAVNSLGRVGLFRLPPVRAAAGAARGAAGGPE